MNANSQAAGGLAAASEFAHFQHGLKRKEVINSQ